MSYSTNLKQWDDIGEEYPDTYSYQQGEQPIAEWDNYVIDNVIKDIQHLVTRTNDELLEKSGDSLEGNLDVGNHALTGSAGSLSFDGTSFHLDGDIDIGSLSTPHDLHVTGNINVEGSVDNVDVSAFKSDYDEHFNTSDGNVEIPNGDLSVSNLDVDGSRAVRSKEGFILSHGDATEERARFIYEDSAIDGFHDGDHRYRFEDLHSGSTIFASDNSGNEIDFQNTIKQNGNQVATRTWTSSNFNNYTDSQARSAVDGASLTNGLQLGRDGISSDGSDGWMEIDGGSSGLLIEYYNEQEVRIGNGSAQVSINDGAPVISSSQGNEGYEIQKNGSDASGVINFKT